MAAEDCVLDLDAFIITVPQNFLTVSIWVDII